MTNPETKFELRNGETIRAYLDELARLKTTVQLCPVGAAVPPFETTLQNITGVTFSSTTTPHLETGQVLSMAFMLDARRFVALVKVVSSGVFRIPLSIAQGERRAEFRGLFERSEPGQVLAVEQWAETVFGGRILLGKLLDLSAHGLRMALAEAGSLSGRGDDLKAGDRFASICISALQFTPPIHCRGRVAHVARDCAEPYAGFALEGLSEGDLRNIERILAPRYPTTFGEAFPAKKRKTDIADKAGALTKTKVTARPAEVVERPVEKPAPAPPPRVEVTAVMRLRKLGKQILFLSGSPEAQHPLAEAFRADGYKHVVQARTFLEAQALTRRTRFDLVVLDMKVGGHWAKEMINALRSHGLLLGVPLILVADYRNEGTEAVAEELAAVHVHERRESYEELAPWLHGFLLED